MLKEEQLLLLNILKESLMEKAYELTFPGNDSFLRLMKLAMDHQLLPLVCEAIYQSKCLQENSLFTPYKKRAIENAALQKIRETQFLHLYKELQAQGIEPMVVKGVVCASLYPREILRQSVDDDLFASDYHFSVCHHFLLDYGLVSDGPVTNINAVDEISYHEEKSPLYLELHRSLFPRNSSTYGHFNRFFEHASERAVFIKSGDMSVKTLCPTDHLLYLILHSFKHFLHSGIGIRPICDIGLFAERYHDEISWDILKQYLEEVNAYEYTRALFCIIKRYLIVNPAFAEDIRDWDILSIEEQPLLEDILDSGIHGASSLSRVHSSTITLHAYRTSHARTHSGIGHSVFPSLKAMQGKYKYLKKAPLLLPFAWAARIIDYIKETKVKPSDNLFDSIKIGKDRVDLLEKYHVI